MPVPPKYRRVESDYVLNEGKAIPVNTGTSNVPKEGNVASGIQKTSLVPYLGKFVNFFLVRCH